MIHPEHATALTRGLQALRAIVNEIFCLFGRLGIPHGRHTFYRSIDHRDRECPGMEDDVRPSWDEWFIEGAKWVAQRADCTRRKAGTVIVKDNRVIATGYNGAPAGKPGCLSGGCPRGRLSMEEIAPYTDYDNGPGRCVAVHSEANAIIHARREDLVGATLYCVPGRPCSACSRLIHGAGIARVVYITESGEVVDTTADSLTAHLFSELGTDD